MSGGVEEAEYFRMRISGLCDEGSVKLRELRVFNVEEIKIFCLNVRYS